MPKGYIEIVNVNIFEFWKRKPRKRHPGEGEGGSGASPKVSPLRVDEAQSFEGEGIAAEINRNVADLYSRLGKVADSAKLIDDIAYGEHGQDFTRIAAEVHDLAQRSAKVIKQIDPLVAAYSDNAQPHEGPPVQDGLVHSAQANPSGGFTMFKYIARLTAKSTNIYWGIAGIVISVIYFAIPVLIINFPGTKESLQKFFPVALAVGILIWCVGAYKIFARHLR